MYVHDTCLQQHARGTRDATTVALSAATNISTKTKGCPLRRLYWQGRRMQLSSDALSSDKMARHGTCKQQ